MDLNETNNSLTPFVSATPRTIRDWAAYVAAGHTPVGGMYMTEHGARSTTLPPATHPSDRAAVGEWLQTMSTSDLVNEVDAARMMIGMRDDNLHEMVTLMEGGLKSADLMVSSGRAKRTLQQSSLLENGDIWVTGDSSMAGPVNDDILVTLDRMRDLSSKVLLLESRLRRQHLEARRSMLNGPAILTIGEGHVLVEMKMANDNLRWQLQQRQRSLLAAQSALSILRERAAAAELRAEAAEAENMKLKKKIAKLEK